VETTNGDGFGLGWYGSGDGPAVYRNVAPAWGDENLRELAAHVESPLFIAHVRATTGTAILSFGLEDDPIAGWSAQSASSRQPPSGTGWPIPSRRAWD
jgi:hypothetical protein